MEVSKGAGVGVGGGGAGAERAEEEVSGPQSWVLRVPGNVIMGSSRFQQFFRIYAKLMAGLKDSKVSESDTTPLAMQRAVMRVGNPSLEELDWAICEIWPEMNEPTFISIIVTSP